MAELKVLACGICKEMFQPDPRNTELESLNACGHTFHSECLHKFETEGDVILRLCFLCKTDYSKLGTLKMKPLFLDLQLEGLRVGGEDCGVGEHKAEMKALKTEVKNLKAQIKKDAKIAAEQQKSSELKAQIAKNKIRRLVTGVKDLNSSMMKFVDASDFETVDEAVVTGTVSEPLAQPVHSQTRSKDKDGGTSGSAGSNGAHSVGSLIDLGKEKNAPGIKTSRSGGRRK